MDTFLVIKKLGYTEVLVIVNIFSCPGLFFPIICFILTTNSGFSKHILNVQGVHDFQFTVVLCRMELVFYF